MMGNNTEEVKYQVQMGISPIDDCYYVAVDKNGLVCGYKDMPILLKDGNWLGDDCCLICELPQVPTNHEQCCWKVVRNLGKLGLVDVLETKPNQQGIEIVPLYDDFVTPSYATPGSAAFDIRSPIDFELCEHKTTDFGLGFKAKIPDGYAGLVLPRSGLGSKYGVKIRNTAGLIDSDYIGEWKASLHLDALNPFKFTDKGEPDSPVIKFNKGDRILQCVIFPVIQFGFTITDKLTETQRGEGGIGHTGVK